MVGFQLVTGKDMFVGDYIKFMVYLSSCLSQLYVLCWNGDSLIQIVRYSNIMWNETHLKEIFTLVYRNGSTFIRL